MSTKDHRRLKAVLAVGEPYGLQRQTDQSLSKLPKPSELKLRDDKFIHTVYTFVDGPVNHYNTKGFHWLQRFELSSSGN